MGICELDGVKKILGRALIDQRFREKLFAVPKEFVFLLRYGELSEDAMASFKTLGSGEFPEAAQEVGDRLGVRAVVVTWI